MDYRTKKEARYKRLCRYMWRVSILEWCLAVLVSGYLCFVGWTHEQVEHKVLACSDPDDYAQLPEKNKRLCGKNKP
jgi:hypothetical protein